MTKENQINTIIEELIKSGSNLDYLDELKEKELEIVKKKHNLDEVLNSIANDIEAQTQSFLNSKNTYGINYISGISTCIYLPDFNNNGEYKLKLIGGNKSRNCDLKVDQNTLFDVASITKLYTLILLFHLEEQGIINLNDKICDINPDFPNLEDFTLNDLIRLHGEMRTDGNIRYASSKEEAYQILKTLYLTSNTREKNTYTDFGAIVIGDTIEKIVSKHLGKEMTFKKIMEEYLLKPLNLTDMTQFNPESSNLSGNGNDLKLVHDPKSRILGGAVGHAGLFTTSEGLARLSKELYSVNYIMSKESLRKLGEITFPKSEQNNKGHLGIFVKHPLGYEKTYTPPEFSTGSFSHQGWTGSIAAFDPYNLIHHNILVNAIYENTNKEMIKNDKPLGFRTAIKEYQKQITKNIMLMWVTKQYYNRYLNIHDDINMTKILK